MFLSPFFMVRLLTVEQFGEYRDFLLYSTMILTIVEFSANGSLAYFIPREPSRERLYFTQASVFVFFTSTIAAVLVLVFSNYVPSEVIREHKYALFLYTMFLCNLDAWEVLWIVKKQTMNILYYSLTRLAVRTAVVVFVAYYSRQVSTIIWSLVIFEAIRLFVMTGYAVKQKLLIAEFNPVTLRAQLAFFGPLGISNTLYAANLYMGQLYISAVMGPAMLGMYTIGTYLNPIIRVFRSSIGDVIMPEIASKTDEAPKVALVLWQRATVVYCVVMVPMAVLFFYYADVFISVPFTEAYADAIPIFQVFALLLVRECFDFTLPLRIVNRTKLFVHVNVFMIAINLGLMLLLYDYYGILGPALAMVITRFLAGFVFAAYVMKYCDYTFAGLLPWVDIGKVVLLCLACVPVLLIGDMIEVGALIRSLLFASIYTLLYVVLLMKLGIDDVREFILRLLKRTQ